MPGAQWLIREETGWLHLCQSNSRSSDPGEQACTIAAVSDEKSSLLVVDPSSLDLHLSYSAGLEHGPIILRSGVTSPIMEDPAQPGSYTTDPDLQRIGAYFIKSNQRSTFLRKISFLFAGNYILYGGLTTPAQAQEEATQTLLNHFRGTEIEAPPQFVPATFSLAVVKLVRDSKGIVSKILGMDARLFEGDSAELQIEASGEMADLYAETYPGYDQRFATLKETLDFSRTVKENLKKYLRLLVLLSRTESHEEAAQRKHSGEIVLMQGCGDLTMNEWNVAFVSRASCNADLEEGEGVLHHHRWALLHPHGEPLNDRKYSCLIKWSCSPDHEDLKRIAERVRIVYPYQIASLQFLAPSLGGGDPSRHVFLQGEPIGHLIEFAVYGRRVCRSGQATNLAKIVREFSDVRHIFKLPNLNPGSDFDSVTRKAGIPEYRARPRNLFNRSTYNDVWLGEAALIQGDRNLRLAAYSHSIQLNLHDLGAPREWIQCILEDAERRNSTYRYVEDPAEGIEHAGEWRWITEGRETWLEIFLLRSQYPCSMIGVRADDEGRAQPPHKTGIVETKELYFLAHGHRYNALGCTIHQTASFLLERGAWDALLFDEGLDVFQLVRNDQGDFDEKISLKRKQLRCIFWANVRPQEILSKPPSEDAQGPQAVDLE